MSFSYYGPLCTKVYDITKPVGHSLGGDIEFYLNLLQPCHGRILEAMSGSGRMLISLLEAGLKVDGVDYSEAMLQSCRNRCAERGLPVPELFAADLVTLQLPYRYEMIIIPSGSLMLFQDREASIQVLQNLYDHLEPGGKLVFDLFVPDVTQSTSIETSTVPLTDGDTITVEVKTTEVNLLHQYQTKLIRYEQWHQGNLANTELQQLTLRWYGLEELRLVLEKIGFVDIQVYADFNPSKLPTQADQKLVYEASRQA
ncbi:class I SAM-dependent methyltransferase [Paenibacillus silvae]|uniref:class I SAM-dependent methyltransferase n=1 Tax=Paenibacillus silvae TaxID=1325358 RepID=UPI0025A21B45|nr:class I SAM-dependent methyltransferase [Paenibacillus silvae]MDM5280956.1 class I SAM-dependent methyltransferase [Paenibacillus silvae]